MKPTVYWLQTPAPGRLGTMPRPRGGAWLETEIQQFHQMGIDTIVSLLTYPEMVELDLTQEVSFCENHGVDFISFPIEDFNVPDSMLAVRKLVDRLIAQLEQNNQIAIHCRMGIGRSSLIAAATLVVRHGVTADVALANIEQCRGRPVPDTQAQRDWVASFSDYIKLS